MYGFVQLLYEKLAVQKLKSGMPVFVFWDKKCLNYGANWEEGFMNGLRRAKVIILLLSTKVFYFISYIHFHVSHINFKKALEGIRQNATKKQDNVLLEYQSFLPLLLYLII